MNHRCFPKNSFEYLIKECILPYKWAFLISLLLVFAETSIKNILNWLFAGLIEAIGKGTNPEILHQVLWFVGIIIICNFINIFLPKHVIMYRQKYLYFPVEETVYSRAISYIFAHSVNYIINKQTGALLSKTNQINRFQGTFSIIINQFWGIISDVGVKMVLLMIINVWLGVLFLICSIIVAVANYYSNKPNERLSNMASKSEALYTGWLVDTISNIRLVKQFNKLEYEKKRLAILLFQYIKIAVKSTLVWFSSFTILGCFIHLCSVGVLAFSVYLWSKSLINSGDIVFVLLTLNGGFMWLMNLCTHYRQFTNNLASIQAGLEPFIVPHEIEDIKDAKVLKVKKGTIEFRNVDFGYSNDKKIFDKFNLIINAGEKIGVVGLSGSGKTTLINLLQRSYEIQGGTIFIDGQDIKNVTQSSLHHNLAIIPQESVLFHRSLKENIAYGFVADDKKIKQAAKKACADDFIEETPDGYNSMVGDRGCKLSGGERQRIIIARAILRNSPILILDEATSALDSESEKKVAKAIDNLVGKQTVIAIAHRLSTLKRMDRIIFIENGKIVETGTFDKLSKKKNGKFAKLWKLQQLQNKD